MTSSPNGADPLQIEMHSHPPRVPETFRIYRQSLGSQWPLSEQRFLQTGSTQVAIARRHGHAIGFALVDHQGTRGYIQIIAVRPTHQAQGIGSALLQASERWLARRAVTIVHAGRGRHYLWQGAPGGCEGFFRRNGYVETETSIDMTLNLGDYGHPAGADDGLPPHVAIRAARPQDAALLPLAFQDDDLADWLGIYTDAMASGQHERILLATLADEIAGFVLVLTEGLTWQACFPGKTGGLGCLGVRQAHRNRGIGRALAATATSQLKREGMTTSYVGWTWLEDWYAALGYRVWRRFHMMQKRLR